MPRLCLPEHTRTTTLAAQILLGLALTGIGILLVGFAFSDVSLGRPITRAWIVAVLGLLLFVPGAFVAGQALVRACFKKKQPRKGQNGPALQRSP